MKKWLIVLVTTVTLLLLLLPITLVDRGENKVNLFSLKTGTKVNTEEISCWKSDSGGFYVFLPAYVDFSAAVFNLQTQSPIYINDKKIANGQGCTDFELNTAYTISYEYYGKKHSDKITFMQSENIATMFIKTETGNMEYIHTNKGKGEAGSLSVYTAQGVTNYNGDIELLSGRGNTSWEQYDKKSYSLDLLENVNVLGLGAAQRWVLLANAEDPTNLRNKIAFDFAKEMNLKCSPDSCWVDLYLNGEYAGLYLLCERNEVSENRLDISSQSGVLMSWEDEVRLETKKQTYITTELGKAYRIHYPKSVSKELSQQIQNKCQAFENALFDNSSNAWLDMIDLESWVRKYLIDEMLGNPDGVMISHYVYFEALDGKMYCGPVWDYDKAMGNDSDKWYNITAPNVFVVGRYKNFRLDNGYIPALLQKPEFSNMAKKLFKDEFLPKLNAFLSEKTPQYIAETNSAFEMNKARWFGSASVGTLKQETEKILKYITDHNRFLQSAWVDGKEYCKISITNLSNDMFFTVPVGGTLKEIPKIDNTEWGVFNGLYYSNSNEPFDITKPINEDIELYAKWIDSSSNKADDLLKLIPVMVIAVLFFAVLVISIKQIRKSR